MRISLPGLVTTGALAVIFHLVSACDEMPHRPEPSRLRPFSAGTAQGQTLYYQNDAGWWSSSAYAPSAVSSRMVAGDFDGDGRDDIAAFYKYGPWATRIHVWRSAGSSFAYQNDQGWWSSSSYSPDAISSRVVAGDFDGDGRDDIAAFYKYDAWATRIHVWRSTGSSLAYQYDAGWWSSSSYSPDAISSRVVAGDFDDDGRNDIAAFYAYDAWETRAHVWLVGDRVCEPSEVVEVLDCTAEIANSTLAQKQVSCNVHGSGYDDGACQLQRCATGYLPAGAECVRDLAGRQMVFANTYRATAGGATTEYLRIGHGSFGSDGSVTVYQFLYDASSNSRQRTTSKVHNPMGAPYGSCTAEIQIIPSAGAYNQLDGTWNLSDGELRIRLGDLVQHWQIDQGSAEGYTLTRYSDADTGSDVVSGVTYSNTIGFAYIADDSFVRSQPISRANLADWYDGELYQNVGTQTADWVFWNFDLLEHTTESDPDVLGYALESEVACVNGVCPFAQSTLLLNYDPYSSLLLYKQMANDFDFDGCIDESGHAYIIFGVMEDSLITKMVYIEYSYETDGYPIVSVGRHYLPAAGS